MNLKTDSSPLEYMINMFKEGKNLTSNKFNIDDLLKAIDIVKFTKTEKEVSSKCPVTDTGTTINKTEDALQSNKSPLYEEERLGTTNVKYNDKYNNILKEIKDKLKDNYKVTGNFIIVYNNDLRFEQVDYMYIVRLFNLVYKCKKIIVIKENNEDTVIYIPAYYKEHYSLDDIKFNYDMLYKKPTKISSFFNRNVFRFFV